MSCEHCLGLSKKFSISLPKDLKLAIKVARDNIADGTIQEISHSSESYECDPPFAELAAGGAWGDIVSYFFQCQYCKQQFHLNAETYHGSGGSWSPVSN